MRAARACQSGQVMAGLGELRARRCTGRQPAARYGAADGGRRPSADCWLPRRDVGREAGLGELPPPPGASSTGGLGLPS